MNHSRSSSGASKERQDHHHSHQPHTSRIRKRPLPGSPSLGTYHNERLVNEKSLGELRTRSENDDEEISTTRLRHANPEAKNHGDGASIDASTSTAAGQSPHGNSIKRTTTRTIVIGTSIIMDLQESTTTTSDCVPTTGTDCNSTITVAHNCLLIPVAIAIWWYWFKRAARRVAKGLIMGPVTAAARGCGTSGRCNDDDDVDDDSMYVNNDNDNEGIRVTSSTVNDSIIDERHPAAPAVAASATNFDDHFQDWNDVMNHNAQDPSVHFVKWFQDSKQLQKQKSRRPSCASSSPLALRRRLKGVAKRAMVFRQRPLAEPSTTAGCAAAASNLSSSTPSRQTPFISRQEQNAAPQEPRPEAAPSIHHNFVTNFTTATSASFDDALSTATSTFAWECIQDTTVGVETLVTLEEANRSGGSNSPTSSSSCDAAPTTTVPVKAKMTNGGDDDGDDDDDESSSIHMNPLV